VALSDAAHAAGFEAIHVVHLELASERDWDLLTIVRDGDWTLVTNNAMEFHRRYARMVIHAGVIFIRPSVRRARQLERFGAALADIAAEPDIVNIAIDVDYDEAGLVRVRSRAVGQAGKTRAKAILCRVDPLTPAAVADVEVASQTSHPRASGGHQRIPRRPSKVRSCVSGSSRRPPAAGLLGLGRRI
jgi:hypothetical protein